MTPANNSIPASSEPAAAPKGVSPSDFQTTRTVKREVIARLHASWVSGAPVPIEELLAHWPADPASDPDLASLLFEDYSQRRRNGLNVNAEDYEWRFPEHRGSLASLVRQHEILH